MKKLALIGLTVFLLVKYTDRGRRAREVYAKEVAAGARPINAVGTATAVFVGLAPGSGKFVASSGVQLRPIRLSLISPNRPF